MSGRTFALLVGINEYAPEAPDLTGCLNDVARFHDYLRNRIPNDRLSVKTLLNAEATRANLIDSFRSHLGRASEGDAAVFQFCGHGARSASHPVFREYGSDAKDEGLVCYDSRRGRGHDLADKEIAVLISEVAAKQAHVTVILDCCHSGTGTRSVGASGLRPRLTEEVTAVRPLETYLDGHYARMVEARGPIIVPRARHVLLAACERGQLAQESADAHGLFSSTLLAALTASRGNISYADLFLRCRIAVRAHAYDQDPQFESYEGFDPFTGFLGQTASPTDDRPIAFCDQGAWIVECGALSGLASAPGASLTLYEEDAPSVRAGTARLLRIGPQRSEIDLDFESAGSKRYLADVPRGASAMPVAFRGDPSARTMIQTAADRSGAGIALVEPVSVSRYSLEAVDGRIVFREAPSGFEIHSEPFDNSGTGDARGQATGCADRLARVVAHVARFEQRLLLGNPKTAMTSSPVSITFVLNTGGRETRVEGTGATLSCTKDERIRGRIVVKNRSPQTLHALLLYFSPDFGVHVLHNDPLAPGEEQPVWGLGVNDFFYLEPGGAEAEEIFKIVFSTERIDDFVLAQRPLPELLAAFASRGDDGKAEAPPTVAIDRNDWFTRDLRVRLVSAEET